MGRFEAALGLIGIVALASTYFLVSGRNPLPKVATAMQGWLARAGSLSTPEPPWRQQLGDLPTAGTVVGHTVVFATRSGVDVRDAGTGKVLWTRPARWVAVAGDTVLLSQGRTSGYDAVDPATGAARWHNPGLAVWAYRDGLLSLSCPAHQDCVLSRSSTVDGAARWTASLPDGARALSGVHASADGVPPMLGLRVDDQVIVVNTATGARPRQESTTEGVRVTVLGGRVLRSTASHRDEDCKLSIEARDPASGRTTWRKTGYGLGAAPAFACAQGRSPVGAGTFIVTVRTDNRPALLSTADGHELWLGQPGETVLAADPQGAVVRSADKGSLTLVGAGGGEAWTRKVSGDVTLADGAVVVSGTDAGRLVAYDRGGGGTLLDVATQAAVLGAGPDGVVLGQDRTVGVLPFHP